MQVTPAACWGHSPPVLPPRRDSLVLRRASCPRPSVPAETSAHVHSRALVGPPPQPLTTPPPPHHLTAPSPRSLPDTRTPRMSAAMHLTGTKSRGHALRMTPQPSSSVSPNSFLSSPPPPPHHLYHTISTHITIMSVTNKESDIQVRTAPRRQFTNRGRSPSNSRLGR